MSILLEVCANSVTSALTAQEGGASRVELCENLNEGGTTPSYGAIVAARKLLKIDLFVLIRPRAGDFLYSDLEFDIMLNDIKLCIETGCDGIVSGILNADGTIDVPRCTLIAEMAKKAGISNTFHRAFDVCANQFEAMETIIKIGFDRILTSGGKSTAIEGARQIAELAEKAKERIIIMPGSGINPLNVADLVHFTKVNEIHASAKVKVPSKMLYRNDHIIMDELADEYVIDFTDLQQVKNILKNANK